MSKMYDLITNMISEKHEFKEKFKDFSNFRFIIDHVHIYDSWKDDPNRKKKNKNYINMEFGSSDIFECLLEDNFSINIYCDYNEYIEKYFDCYKDKIEDVFYKDFVRFNATILSYKYTIDALHDRYASLHFIHDSISKFNGYEDNIITAHVKNEYIIPIRYATKFHFKRLLKNKYYKMELKQYIEKMINNIDKNPEVIFRKLPKFSKMFFEANIYYDGLLDVRENILLRKTSYAYDDAETDKYFNDMNNKDIFPYLTV